MSDTEPNDSDQEYLPDGDESDDRDDSGESELIWVGRWVSVPNWAGGGPWLAFIDGKLRGGAVRRRGWYAGLG